MRIAVIGAGIMGLSAAWALASRGHRVEVFEQAHIPNPDGSSVDAHRLIRFAYDDMDGYVRMVAEAYQAWARLWADLGVCHYRETGTLALDAGGDGWARRSRQSLQRTGIPFEDLRPGDAAGRFPHLRFDGLETALFLPSGGVLLAERIVADLARHLESRREVALHRNARVTAIEAEAGRLGLADGRAIAADQIVVAAGPWARDLLPALGGRMTPSRQVVAYLRPPPPLLAAWASGPMVLKIGAASGFYAVPPVAGTGLKIGDHRFSLSGDPAAPRAVAAGEAEGLMAEARHSLAAFDRYALDHAKVCFYDVAAEERFVVEPLGARAWLLSGFSGHGFKFGPVIGERLAACLAGEITPARLGAWAAARE